MGRVANHLRRQMLQSMHANTWRGALALLIAVCSVLAMLLPANLPQAQAATTIQLSEHNVKLSTFNGSNGVMNSAFSTDQTDAIREQVSSRVLGGANVTRMIAVRAQFVQDNGSAYPWKANTSYHGGFSFKVNPVSPLATDETAQWHLVKVNGPQDELGWIWNTTTDTTIRNRMGTAFNWGLSPDASGSVHATEVQDAVTVDDSGNLVSVQDADMTWPGVYVLVETGTRDPAKSDNADPGAMDEFEIRQTVLGNANTRLFNRAKAWNTGKSTLQYAAVRIQFVDSTTRAPITSAPNSTFKGGNFRTGYTLYRQATKNTSKWTVLKLAAPSAQIADQWYWNTDGDQRLLSRVNNSVPVIEVKNGAVTDVNGNLTAIKDDNVTQPAIYMAVETGTKDTGGAGKVKLPKANLPAGTVLGDTYYYGFALQDNIYKLGISTTAPNGTTPAKYAQAFCYNPLLMGPYLPIYAGREYNVTYGEVMNSSGYLDLLDTRKNGTGNFLPDDVRQRLTGTKDEQGLQLKALVSKIFYDAYVLDGLNKYHFTEDQLNRAVSIAVHRLVTSESILNQGYRGKQDATQWNAAGELVQYALNQDPAPSDDQIQVRLFAATVKRIGAGGEMQRLLTYRVPVQFDKVDKTTKQRLEGAHLLITDSDRTGVDGWDSDGSTIHSKFLDEGTYTLQETVEPAGYEAANWKYQFKVDGNGRMTPVNEVADITAKQNLVTIGNTPEPERKQYVIRVSKVDGSNIAVVDAELALYRVENGAEHEIFRWISDGRQSIFAEQDAGTYVLREISVPEGYEKADDISFTIGESPARNAGSTEANTTFSEGNASVTMVDNKKTATFTSLPLTGMSSGLIAWIMVGVFLALALISLLLAVLIKRRNR